jgi:carbonic anhydrase
MHVSPRKGGQRRKAAAKESEHSVQFEASECVIAVTTWVNPSGGNAMPDKSFVAGNFKRRRFLQAAFSSAVAGTLVQTGIELAYPTALRAQTALTPESALQTLVEGNQRFSENRLSSFQQDLDILKSHTVDKQEPFAAVLSCADSRVPVELLFDQTIGHVFVTRVAGNLATPEIIASLEYGVAVLGVKVLVVLGHVNCGAVKAAMKADTVPGQISALYQYLKPAVDQSGGNFEKAIELNAKYQADLLGTSSPVIKQAAKSGALKITSGVYDLATGKVNFN